MLDSIPFWQGAGERAVKTFAQALLATLTISSGPLDVLHTGWAGVLSIALGSTLLSLLTSLGSLGVDTPAAAASRAGRHEAGQ